MHGRDKHPVFNGIVSRLIQGDNDGKVITYYAELRPWLWQLNLSEDCRIFQNKKNNGDHCRRFWGTRFYRF